MIKSILDNDFYSFTQQQAILRLYPRAHARYEFINRGDVRISQAVADQLQMFVDGMRGLMLSLQEAEWLENMMPRSLLTNSYIDFLSGYRFDPCEVKIRCYEERLKISIEGPWYRTVLWEVPLLAMVSELQGRMTIQKQPDSEEECTERNIGKALRFKGLGVSIADFGTRRRHSYKNHLKVLRDLVEHAGESFIGTSNVALAILLKVRVIGTQSHQWFMFHAAKYGYRIANEMALEKWVEVYQGDLGIALSDTFTSRAFLKDAFKMKYAKLFDGVRHDSGPTVAFANNVIEHYGSLGIDPTAKTIVFSDGLDVDAVEKIESHCRGRINTAYGIGTNLTNDVGIKPLNIVIKMTGAAPEGKHMYPTVKLSDVPGKWTGDKAELEICRREFGI